MLSDNYRQYLCGVGFYLLTTFLFATLDTTAKYLVQDVSPILVVSSRYVGHMVVAIMIFGIFMQKNIFYNFFKPLYLIRSLFIGMATLCNFTAIQYLPLTIIATMFFLSPFFVTIFSIIVFKEKIGWRRWLALIVGFSAIVFIIKPTSDLFHWAIFISLGTSIFYAGFQVMQRMSVASETAEAAATHNSAVPSIIFVPFLIYGLLFGDVILPSNDWNMFLLIIIGSIGFLGQYSIIIALRFASAATLAPFQYPQIIFMSFYSYLIFSQPPQRDTIIGAVIIVACGLFIWWRDKIAHQQKA